MNGQEAFRRFTQQLQKAGRGAGGGGKLPGGKGFFAGSGLLVALVGGGLALNASLFNGMSAEYFQSHDAQYMLILFRSRWWSPSNQVY